MSQFAGCSGTHQSSDPYTRLAVVETYPCRVQLRECQRQGRSNAVRQTIGQLAAFVSHLVNQFVDFAAGDNRSPMDQDVSYPAQSRLGMGRSNDPFPGVLRTELHLQA